MIRGVDFEYSDYPLVALQEDQIFTHAQLSERVNKALDHQVELLASDQNLRVVILNLPKKASEEHSSQYLEKRITKLFCAQSRMEQDVLHKKEYWGDRLLVPIRNAFNGGMSSLYSTKLWLSPAEPGRLEKLHIMNSFGQCVGMSRTFEYLCLRMREKKGTLNRNDAIRIAALFSGGATEEAAIEQSGENRDGGCRDGFFVVPIVLTAHADLSPGYLSVEQISQEFGIYDFTTGRHRRALLQTDDGFTLLFEPQGGLIDITGRLKEVFDFEPFNRGSRVKQFNSWKAKYTAAREELLKELFSDKIAELELIDAVRTMVDNWTTSEEKGFLYRRFTRVDPKMCQSADAIFRTIEDHLLQKFWRLCSEYYQIAKVALRPATLPNVSI